MHGMPRTIDKQRARAKRALEEKDMGELLWVLDFAQTMGMTLANYSLQKDFYDLANEVQEMIKELKAP